MDCGKYKPKSICLQYSINRDQVKQLLFSRLFRRSKLFGKYKIILPQTIILYIHTKGYKPFKLRRNNLVNFYSRIIFTIRQLLNPFTNRNMVPLTLFVILSLAVHEVQLQYILGSTLAPLRRGKHCQINPEKTILLIFI